MKTSIFIVSYMRDRDWMPYCLRSIEKYCDGFDEVVVAVPVQDVDAFKRLNLPLAKIAGFGECGIDPFMAHQALKCSADLYCTGDLILHTDSDCIFTEHVTPDTYRDRTSGLPMPILWYTPYASLGSASPWQECTQRCLGFQVEHEFMRRHGAIHFRQLYADFRAHVLAVHGKDLWAYLKGKRQTMPSAADSFSEFNALGAYAWKAFQKYYHWVNTDIPDEAASRNPIKQMWSHHRANHPDVQKVMAQYL